MGEPSLLSLLACTTVPCTQEEKSAVHGERINCGVTEVGELAMTLVEIADGMMVFVPSFDRAEISGSR